MRSRNEIEASVDRVLCTILRIDSQDVALSRREDTKGWTSLMQIEIFFALEEEFGVRFGEDAMAFAESRNDLVDAVIEALS